MKKKPNIENDTPIMPWVVAETSVDEVIGWLHSHGHKKQAEVLHKNKQKIESHLVETLNKIYENNEKFRAKLKRIKRIDDLYVWVEHWLASYLNINYHIIFSLLPRGYGWDVRLTRGNPDVANRKAFNKNPSDTVVGLYHTQSGKVGVEIKRSESGKHSYIGAWGAGSGHKYEDMASQLNSMLRYHPRHSVIKNFFE